MNSISLAVDISSLIGVYICPDTVLYELLLKVFLLKVGLVVILEL